MLTHRASHPIANRRRKKLLYAVSAGLTPANELVGRRVVARVGGRTGTAAEAGRRSESALATAHPCHRTVRSGMTCFLNKQSISIGPAEPWRIGFCFKTGFPVQNMLRSIAARVCHTPTRLVSLAKGFTAQASSATSDRYRDQGGKDNPLLDLDGLDDDTEITEDQKNRQLLEEISSDITDSLQVCAPRQELPTAVS